MLKTADDLPKISVRRFDHRLRHLWGRRFRLPTPRASRFFHSFLLLRSRSGNTFAVDSFLLPFLQPPRISSWTPRTSHAVNSFSPMRALGGAIDRLRGGATKEANEKNTERLLTDPVLKEMLGAGWQTVTYRQNTELMIEAWHWNARGTWSNAAKQEGYFTGSAEPTARRFCHSWAYPLPHRGATEGDGNGWSRLTDGDLEILLEEQSVPDQGLHGRRRLAASAMGDDRSGRES